MVDINSIWPNILSGFKEIFASPLKDLSILWILTPIILVWLLLEVYFGRFKKEKLGWNTALGNGITMFWIVVISLRVLFSENLKFFSLGKLIFIIIIGLYALFIIYISFSHKIQDKFSFIIASPTIVYYLSGVAVLWINNLIEMSLWVVIDLVILYIFIIILEAVLKKLIPTAVEEIEHEFGKENNLGGNLDSNFGDLK